MNKPDLKELDKKPISNLMAKQMKLDTALNMLRNVSNMFDYASESKIRSYAERLVNQNISLVALELACEKIIDNFDRFPSYKAFIDVLRHFNIHRDKTKCDKCDSQGLVGLFNKSDGICYAFACSCDNGSSYPAFKCVADINLNQFTRFAPTDFGKKNPYESFNARWQKYLQSMGKIS